MSPTELRERAAERRRAGWEISDAMTPPEMEKLANEIDRLRADLQKMKDKEAALFAMIRDPESN